MVRNGNLEFVLGAEIRNCIIEKLASSPGTTVQGRMYFDTTEDKYMYYSSTEGAFIPFGNAILVENMHAAGGELYNIDGTYNDTAMNLLDNISGTVDIYELFLQIDLKLTYIQDNYLWIWGGTMQGDILMGGVPGSPGSPSIQVRDPVLAIEVANKQFVETMVTDVKTSNVVASPADGIHLDATYHVGNMTLTSNDVGFNPLVMDGITPSVGQRVLIKDQNEVAEDNPSRANGIYTVTQQGDSATVPWILTRAVDMNTAAEVHQQHTTIDGGDTQEGHSYITQMDIVADKYDFVLGESAIIYQRFGSAAIINPGYGLEKVGNDFNVRFGSGITQAPLGFVGIAIDDTASGLEFIGSSPIDENSYLGVKVGAGLTINGSGEVVLNNEYLYDATGAPSTTHIITHNLGQRWVNYTVYNVNTGEAIVPYNVVAVDANTLRVEFGSASVECAVVIRANGS